MFRLSIAILLALAGCGTSQASLVAYWNFNELTPGNGLIGAGYVAPSNADQTLYLPTSGAGSLTLFGITSDAIRYPWGITNYAGTATNAIAGDPAGQALAIEGSNEQSGPAINNGASLVFQFDLTNYVDPVLSFDTKMRISTQGFRQNQVAYSTDGVNYTNFGNPYTPATTFVTATFNLSAIDALDNRANVFLRVTLNGATNWQSDNLFDNIQLNATLRRPPSVPEPSTLLCSLSGICAIVAARRLRRRRASRLRKA